MHYGTIKKTDIANGVGVRVSLFVSGCRRHCKNCFNPETWNFAYGTPFTEQSQAEILQALAPGYISGLSILGGEPFERENQHDLLPFVRAVKQVLHRLCAGGRSAEPGGAGAFRRHGRAAFLHRCAGGWAVYRGTERYFAALSWVEKSAPIRPFQDSRGGNPRLVG